MDRLQPLDNNALTPRLEKIAGEVSKLSLISWMNFEAYDYKNLGSPQGESYLSKYTPQMGGNLEGGFWKSKHVFRIRTPTCVIL